jgi:hypothetical protein
VYRVDAVSLCTTVLLDSGGSYLDLLYSNDAALCTNFTLQVPDLPTIRHFLDVHLFGSTIYKEGGEAWRARSVRGSDRPLCFLWHPAI